MKNVELTYWECSQIIAVLKREREELEKAAKLWSDRAESAIEEKSYYESIARSRLERIDEVNRIIDKLNVD